MTDRDVSARTGVRICGPRPAHAPAVEMTRVTTAAWVILEDDTGSPFEPRWDRRIVPAGTALPRRNADTSRLHSVWKTCYASGAPTNGPCDRGCCPQETTWRTRRPESSKPCRASMLR